MKKLLIVIGTRPNFIKVTQFKKEAEQFPNLEVVLVHTGQHYDKNMSEVFFQQFGLVPDYFLNVHANSVNQQIGAIITALDEVVEKVGPDMMMAVGDVNSTLCASLVANKRNILLGHLESGLRSRDRAMPEEINRLLTDEITDHFFVTEKSGEENLLAEGKNPSAIHFVGNTMIDTLVAFENEIAQSPILNDLDLIDKDYLLLTMHRPSNVDNLDGLNKLIALLEKTTDKYEVVFPIHPRTVQKLKDFSLWNRFEKINNLKLLEPLDYFSFQGLIANAKIVLTDSGGIQEETTFKQIPCLTIRENTERPVTITEGTNQLVDFEVDQIAHLILSESPKEGSIPDLWDGKSTQRILKIIDQILA